MRPKPLGTFPRAFLLVGQLVEGVLAERVSTGKTAWPMSELSEIHRRHILHGFLSVHKQMAELEALLIQSETASPFSQLVRDLSPTECSTLKDHFARIRSAMLAHLEDLGIPLEVRRSKRSFGLLKQG